MPLVRFGKSPCNVIFPFSDPVIVDGAPYVTMIVQSPLNGARLGEQIGESPPILTLNY